MLLTAEAAAIGMRKKDLKAQSVRRVGYLEKLGNLIRSVNRANFGGNK
jgi:hypothetical protein